MMIYLDWKFTHEIFNSLESSNEFQERYMPISICIKKEENVEIKQTRKSITPAGRLFSFK